MYYVFMQFVSFYGLAEASDPSEKFKATNAVCKGGWGEG